VHLDLRGRGPDHEHSELMQMPVYGSLAAVYPQYTYSCYVYLSQFYPGRHSTGEPI